MAEAEWSPLAGNLDAEVVRRGVSAGIVPKPLAPGHYVYAMSSVADATGAVGLATNQGGFAPMALGADVSGVLRRSGAGGAPLLFCSLASPTADARGYLLGLSDGDGPSYITLRKGELAIGLPSDTPGSASGVLARSSEPVPLDGWAQLRMEVVVNASGDVVINCYRGNVSAAPSWTAIPGMSGFPGGVAATAFIDEALGINTGLQPLSGGYAGFAGAFRRAGARLYFDRIAVARQTK